MSESEPPKTGSSPSELAKKLLSTPDAPEAPKTRAPTTAQRLDKVEKGVLALTADVLDRLTAFTASEGEKVEALKKINIATEGMRTLMSEVRGSTRDVISALAANTKEMSELKSAIKELSLNIKASHSPARVSIGKKTAPSTDAPLLDEDGKEKEASEGQIEADSQPEKHKKPRKSAKRKRRSPTPSSSGSSSESSSSASGSPAERKGETDSSAISTKAPSIPAVSVPRSTLKPVTVRKVTAPVPPQDHSVRPGSKEGFLQPPLPPIRQAATATTPVQQTVRLVYEEPEHPEYGENETACETEDDRQQVYGGHGYVLPQTHQQHYALPQYAQQPYAQPQYTQYPTQAQFIQPQQQAAYGAPPGHPGQVVQFGGYAPAPPRVEGGGFLAQRLGPPPPTQEEQRQAQYHQRKKNNSKSRRRARNTVRVRRHAQHHHPV